MGGRTIGFRADVAHLLSPIGWLSVPGDRAYYASAMVHRLTALMAILTTLAAACLPGGGPLIGDVTSGEPSVSPELRNPQNHLVVGYRLGGPAEVSAYIQGPDGKQWPVYERATRTTAGQYQLNLDGTVPGPGEHDRRVLPDGDYHVVLRADAGAQHQQVEVPFTVRAADTTPPEIHNLQAFPDRISPNADARDDIAQIAYAVSKASRVTPFAELVSPDGRRKRMWTGEELKVEAGEQRLQWDGTQSGVPVPDGQYELGVRARDAAGNQTEARRPMVVESGGIPQAKIVSARLAPTQIVRGGQVCLDVKVRNIGQTVLRTEGPDPGYTYNSLDTYASIANHQYVEKAGFWRIGLDWAGSADTTGARYPYRWGFGKDLSAGEETTVHGCVQVNDEHRKMVFFAALLQENVAVRESGTALTQVEVSW